MKILDCRQLQCPQPVLETRKHLLDHPGEPVTVLVADSIAQANVSRLAEREGYQVQAQVTPDGIELQLRLDNDLACQIAPAATEPAEALDPQLIAYIASNAMGRGSEELGQLLMRNFLFTLAGQRPLPKALLLVNSGVQLACAESPALEALQNMATAGVDIAVCGLCLEFFQLKDQLAVGRVSNMLETIETLSAANRVLSP